MSQEIETKKVKNDNINSENHVLKTRIKELELENQSIQTKFENISKNVSNFNKGRENLSKIIENSRPSSNKSGLGYKKKLKFSSNEKKKIDSKRINKIEIWVPKTNNNLIRNKHIKSFMESVHNNKNYLYKRDTKPTWVWLPKI